MDPGVSFLSSIVQMRELAANPPDGCWFISSKGRNITHSIGYQLLPPSPPRRCSYIYAT